MTATASSSAPKNTGKKPGQQKHLQMNRREATLRYEGTYTKRANSNNSGDNVEEDGEQLFDVKWLNKTKAKVCYGCSGKLRPDQKGVPPPPFDIVLTTKEFRSWYDKSSETFKVSMLPEATYYHMNPVCVLQRNPGFDALLHVRLSEEDMVQFI